MNDYQELLHSEALGLGYDDAYDQARDYIAEMYPATRDLDAYARGAVARAAKTGETIGTVVAAGDFDPA